MKKKDKKPLIIIILILMLGAIIFMYANEEDEEQIDNAETTQSEENNVNISEAQVEIKTIENTISASGEIQTALEEKLELHATYYFEEIYFEVGDKIQSGENILKYSNGEYMKAPYNLVIASVNIPENGKQCTKEHYIEVYATDTLKMTLEVEEENLNKVIVGQEVNIQPTINSSENYIGNVTQISNTGTYSAKGTTYYVTVTFDNNGFLKVGMSAKADIVLEKAENVLVVPKEAVKNENEQSYVVVVKNNETQNTIVETGISNDAYIEIKSGLEEGQTVQIEKQETKENYRNNANFEKRIEENNGFPINPEGKMKKPEMPRE